MMIAWAALLAAAAAVASPAAAAAAAAGPVGVRGEGGRVHRDDILAGSSSFLAPGADPFTYTGFIPVDNATNSHMFTWFFPSMDGKADAPLVIWLQGGPGGSSLFGLFIESGPYMLTHDLKMVPRRKGNWNEHFHMLYVDNPVGTGFSYADEAGYCHDETCVAMNLYSMIQGFYQKYPAYRQCKLVIAGESYAGKYIPAFANWIHLENQHGNNPQVPLAALSIGDGLIDPVSQVGAYADFAYYNGIVDRAGRATMRTYTQKMVADINRGDFAGCITLFNHLVNAQYYPSFFQNATGILDYFNIARPTGALPNWPDFAKYVESIKDKLHVNGHNFQQNNKVYDALANDICRSVGHLLPTLIQNYRVLLYSGQQDFIVAAPTTEEYLYDLQFPGKSKWEAASREIWYANDGSGIINGYVKQAADANNGLIYALVRNCGHIAPYDQPIAVHTMVENLVFNRPFNTKK